MEGACPSARLGGIRQGPGVRRGVTGKLIFRARVWAVDWVARPGYACWVNLTSKLRVHPPLAPTLPLLGCEGGEHGGVWSGAAHPRAVCKCLKVNEWTRDFCHLLLFLLLHFFFLPLPIPSLFLRQTFQ